eukprot:1641958-Pleurochrysis_carterae.AAC.1
MGTDAKKGWNWTIARGSQHNQSTNIVQRNTDNVQPRLRKESLLRANWRRATSGSERTSRAVVRSFCNGKCYEI